jgi:hypothetical protein
MKKLALYLTLLSQSLFAQLPNTDIWLLDINAGKDTIILSNPVNITSRAGYDNQPAFSPDGKYLLYTSIRDEKQSDIFKYDLKTKQISRFTNTPATSEYSPTFMPDGKNISVVMVEPDSVQRLWKFPIKGGKPSLIMAKVDSIGYHCWINKDSLALIMITEPPSLDVVNIKSQKPKHFKKNVGRCLQCFPDNSFTYLHPDPNDSLEWPMLISTVDYSQISESADPISMPKETQDYYVKSFKTFNGPVAFFGVKNLIIGLSFRTNWVASRTDMKSNGIKTITRIAISPDGTKMAIVAE